MADVADQVLDWIAEHPKRPHRTWSVRNLESLGLHKLTGSVVAVVDEHCGCLPLHPSTEDKDRGNAPNGSCRIQEPAQLDITPLVDRQDSVGKHVDGFIVPQVWTLQRTKGRHQQVALWMCAGCLINTKGLAFEDLSTPGETSRRDFCLQPNHHLLLARKEDASLPVSDLWKMLLRTLISSLSG